MWNHNEVTHAGAEKFAQHNTKKTENTNDGIHLACIIEEYQYQHQQYGADDCRRSSVFRYDCKMLTPQM